MAEGYESRERTRLTEVSGEAYPLTTNLLSAVVLESACEVHRFGEVGGPDRQVIEGISKGGCRVFTSHK